MKYGIIHYFIEDKIVKVDGGLGIGAKINIILVELIIRSWKEDKVINEIEKEITSDM